MKTLVIPVLLTSSFLAAQGEVKVPRPPDTQPAVKTSAERPAPQAPSLELPGGSALPARSKGLAGNVPVPEARRLGRCYDQSADGTLWVATDDWKAGFDQDGPTFVPFFGSNAPTNYPAAFRLQHVTVDGVQTAQGKVQPTRNGDVVSYQRPGMVEAYEVRAEGLEQTFTFATLPARGEIAVTMAVQTPLEVSPQGREFVFANQLGSFRYGAALAVDGNGNRLDLVTEYRDGALTITVPQSFVAEAALPLVIDPVIGNVTAGYNHNRSITSPDIAYVAAADEYVAVWEYIYSQTDSDCYVQVFNGDMVAQGSFLTVDSSGFSWRKCRIAALNLYHRYLVVAEVNSTATPTPWIAGRILAGGASPAFQPSFDIEKAGITGHFGNASNPDVGGDLSMAAPTYFTVVWEYAFGANDHDIYMKQVRHDGTLRAAAPTAIDVSNQHEHHPVLSKTDGQEPAITQAWALAYRREFLLASDGQLRGALVAWDGAIVTVGGLNTFALTGTTPNNEGSWSVSSPQDGHHGRGFLMVQTRRHAQTNVQELHATAFNGTGAVTVPSTRIFTTQSGGGRDLRSPDVDCDGFRFAVGFNEVWAAAPLDLDVWFATFGVTGNQIYRHDVDQGARSTDVENAPSLVARRGAASGHVHGAVWSRDLSATSGRIESQNYESLGLGGVASRATGCGGLALTGQGSVELGGSISFSLTGNGLKGFVAGFPVSVPVGVCPGCTQGVNGNSVITAQLNVAIPMNAALVGSTFAFQGFEFTIGGACLSQLKLSNTLDVTVK